MEKNRYKSKFIHFLENEFERRKAVNNRYSLRGYAQFLSIQPIHLSYIMSGKVPLTSKMAQSMFEKFDFSEEQKNDFTEDIKTIGTLIKNELINNTPITKISWENFRLIQDYYHYVIVEMTKLEDFIPSAEYISARLGITESEAELALKRLIDLDLINIDDNGDIHASVKYADVEPSSREQLAKVLKERHRQVLQKAIETIEEEPAPLYNISTITVAIDEALIHQADKKITKFSRELATWLEEESKNNNQVYEISVSFFPWLKNK